MSDFNPFKVIAGNHDLLWAVRLAWVKAALDILDAAKDAAEKAPHEFNSPRLLDFEQFAREALRGIRSTALARPTDPGHSPIDDHVRLVIEGTSVFIAPGENRSLDQTITKDFRTRSEP